MEYISIKVSKDIYDTLLKMQGLLQYRDKVKYTFSDIIEFLIKKAPEIEIPIDEELRVVYPDDRKSDTSKA